MTNLWQELLSSLPFDPEEGKKSLKTVLDLAKKYSLFSDEELQKMAVGRDAILCDPQTLKNWTAVRQLFSRVPSDAILEESFPAELHGPVPLETFLLLTAVACIPDGERIFREKKLPLEKLYESFDEFRVWVSHCECNRGITGLEFESGFAWIVLRLLPGIVLRFGRLEYNQSLFFSDVLVFQKKKSGEICVMLNGRYPVTEKGLVAIPPEKAVFHTVHPFGCFGTLSGYPVSRDGRIQKETVTLDPVEWERILGPYDPVLFLHIPELGPLMQEQVLQSLDSVTAFYRGNHTFHPKAIVSSSWLFDPVLQELLPESSRLRQFQNTGILLPSGETESEAVGRVFGHKAEQNGVESVEWKTSLQKKLGAYLKNGGICRGGRFLYLMKNQ